MVFFPFLTYGLHPFLLFPQGHGRHHSLYLFLTSGSGDRQREEGCKGGDVYLKKSLFVSLKDSGNYQEEDVNGSDAGRNPRKSCFRGTRRAAHPNRAEKAKSGRIRPTPFQSGVTPANQTKERPVHELSRGHSGTKIQCESCLFSQGKTPEFT